MASLSDGEWWAMAQPGQITFNRGTWKADRLGLAPGIWFWALAPTRCGSGLWLATDADSGEHRGARVLKLEDGKVVEELAPYPWRQDSRHSWINSMVEDGEGRLWIGSPAEASFTTNPPLLVWLPA